MPAIRVRTTLEPFGPAGAIVLNEAQAAELSDAKQPPVVVTIGERSARLRVSRMGGRICIGLSKANRSLLGLELGDTVDAEIAVDDAERTVEVPPELAAALDAEPHLRPIWDELSFTRRKELAAGITQAKQPATRQRRLAAALEVLRSAG